MISVRVVPNVPHKNNLPLILISRIIYVATIAVIFLKSVS